MEGAIGLSSMNQTMRFVRIALSMASEEPDSLGHGFIMPLSLLTELPISKFRHPHIAALWHLAEYMVRKVPTKRPEKYVEDGQFKQLAAPTDMAPNKGMIGTALVEYGILGHNGIFAHRIASAAQKGLIYEGTTNWLLKVLEKNIGRKMLTEAQLGVKKLIKSRSGTDWDSVPTKIDLPHSDATRDWFAVNIPDIWNAMVDLSAETFESMIPGIKKKEWGIIRAAQYALSSLFGHPKSSHIMIFTQSAWNLVDLGLVSEGLASLQTHRMVREYLKDR
jgi:hypothetical protein